jgi:predicted flap endonuclease-1-like 5' DNA nuclease
MNMFQEWGFLLGEIWILLALAALLGLLAGWIIWGRRNNHAAEDALQDKLNACRMELNACIAREAPSVEPAPIVQPIEAPIGEDYDGDGIIEGENEGTRPEALSGPRGGVADDLKQIKGVGAKMEILCNELGFYHFDQIANWSRDEIAWVDANLKGFKGRVTRDEWVSQASVLAAGGTTEFAEKVAKGDVNY